MGLKHDTWIKTQAERAAMISPFAPEQVRELAGRRVISFGLSSYGYDARLAPEFKVARCNGAVLDPKNEDEAAWEDTVLADSFVIPPHGFVLTRTVEYFRIPENVLCVVLGKSTYARLGLVVNVTPLEPAWEGQITLELSNTTPQPLIVYANEGIAQVLFLEGDRPPEVTYASRSGKYQYQEGIVMSKV